MNKQKGWFYHNGTNYAEQQGFTLLEILITTTLIFIVFSLVYLTFFSISRSSSELQRRMQSSEIVFRFLKGFNKEIKCIIHTQEDENFYLDREQISFVTKGTYAYPVKITYFTEATLDNGETLFRKQENLIDGYSFVFPVLKETDSIDFFFYEGEKWSETADMEKVTAVAVELDYAGEKIFFPVYLYREKYDAEEKK
jgi:prepilin-type N-terminal cleavage/methylation domain-containing protein